MIPVFEPDVGDAEIESVVAALRRGELSGSFGRAIAEFEAEFAAYVGCAHGVAVTSGTTALSLAVAAASIGAGEEVLVSACTNVATALAPYHAGAVAVPVDSEPTTWNLDLDRIDELVTPKTRAIIPVHIYGHPVDMDRLLETTRRHGLVVIEDCAEAHGATVRGRKAGSFGDMACFSFYANKIITTGEGGMVTTNDAKLAERLRLLRNLGFTQPRFRHEVAGFNYRMTGYQAAMGVAQVRRIEAIIEQKRRVAKTYDRLLSGVPGITGPAEREWARNVYWMYGLVADPRISRDRVTAALHRDGIETRTFFCPMGQQPFLRAQPGFRDIPCPVADGLWERGFYLPSSTGLDEQKLEHIARSVARAVAESSAS